MRGFTAVAKLVSKLFLGALPALAFPSAAWSAADPSVTVSLAQIVNTVTLSRPGLKTYAAYRLTIENKTTNTLNRLYVNAKAINVGNESSPPTFDSSIIDGVSGTCAEYHKSTITCETNLSLSPNQSNSDFILFVEVPTSGQKIRIEYAAGGHEGNGMGSGCCAIQGMPVETALIDSVFDPSVKVNAKTVIRIGGGEVFTGLSAVPVPQDLFSVVLTVPPLSTSFAVAELGESSPSPTGSGNEVCPPNVACQDFVDVLVRDKEGSDGKKLRFDPQAVVNPLDQYLAIKLTKDGTSFRGNLNNATVWYFDEGTPASPNGQWLQIFDCVDKAKPLQNVDRCVYERKVFKNSDPEVRANAALANDARITVLAKENGRIAW